MWTLLRIRVVHPKTVLALALNLYHFFFFDDLCENQPRVTARAGGVCPALYFHVR